MRTPSKAIAFALAVVATLALAGCVQPPAHVIPTSEPSVAPVFKSDAAALAAAKKAYLVYLAVSDQILIDGGKHPERLLAVATEADAKKQNPGFAEAESKGLRSTGGTRIDEITLQGYFPSHSKGVVVVYACIDVSKVDVLDSAGKSVVSASRPDTATYQTTFDLASREGKKLLVADEEPWMGKTICS